MWGTRGQACAAMTSTRFIPAYVGNTRERRCTRNGDAVHPRVCGEHPRTWTARLRGRGSSPRMWGTRQAERHQFDLRRFIPAYVGNTFPSRQRGLLPAVHPRVCGEHMDLKVGSEYAGGSSPRMWGTPEQVMRMTPRQRFIPAYVGNTTQKPGE